MDTEFLESFVMVAELGSVANAARRLNITPAAVSQRLLALERDLGHPLVARVGRVMRPTAEGAAILPKARDLISAARDLRHAAGLGAPSGLMRIGATASAMTGMIADILAQMRRDYPKVEFYIRPGASSELYQALLADDLDAALLVHPQFVPPKSLAWEVLRVEALLLIAPRGTDLSDPDRVIQTHPFIRYDRSQWGGQIVEKYLKERGLKVREWLELDALDAITTLVDRGMGVAIIPDWAPPWPGGLSLERCRLDAGETRKTGVMWRRVSPVLPAVSAFVDTALQVCPAVSR